MKQRGLDTAMREMEELLGEVGSLRAEERPDSENDSLRAKHSSAQLTAGGNDKRAVYSTSEESEVAAQQLDEYIGVLDARYGKIVTLLEQEGAQLRGVQEENEQLKQQLADVMAEARKYQDEKAQEIKALEKRLVEKSTRRQARKLEAHYKRVELEKVQEILDELEKEISEKIAQGVRLRVQQSAGGGDGRQNSQPPVLETLQQQIELHEGVLHSEILRLQELNDSYQSSIQVLAQFKHESATLANQKREQERQIAALYGKQVSYDKENREVQQSFKGLLQKGTDAFRRWQDICALHEQLLELLAQKTREMSETRTRNAYLDECIKSAGTLEHQLLVEQHNYNSMLLERELLQNDLERVLTGITVSRIPPAVGDSPQNKRQQSAAKNNCEAIANQQSQYQQEQRLSKEQEANLESLLNLERIRGAEDAKRVTEELAQANYLLQENILQSEEKLQQKNEVVEHQLSAIAKISADEHRYKSEFENEQAQTEHTRRAQQVNTIAKY